MKKICFLFLLSLLWACNNNEQNKDGQGSSDPIDSVSTKNIAQEVLSDSFYEQYIGTINGNIPVHLSLVKTGKKLRGSYYYDRHGIPLTLMEGKLADDGSMSFLEFGTMDQTGSIEAILKEKTLRGFWYNIDKSKKLVMELAADTASNRMLFDVFHESKKVSLVANDTASPSHTFIQTVLYPSISYQGEHKEAIYGLFNNMFRANLAEGNPYQTIANMHEEAIKEYRDANLNIYQEDPSFGYGMNWSEVAHMEVVYNSNGLLSLGRHWYNYTGGAHGNYGASFYVIDLNQGKYLTLDDVLLPQYHGEVSLMIQQKVLEMYRNAKNETLQDLGFDTEAIKPTGNFYLTDKGIGFYYSPYEVGPYAVGRVEVFIPFKEMNEFLTEAYRQDS